jgi:osmotically-inducible protein OsmY
VDRVKSEIFEHPGLPKGDLNFEAREGVVTVHGQVAEGAQIHAIEKAIRRVPGVLGVRNLLHLPGTPAPNKAAALRVS